MISEILAFTAGLILVFFVIDSVIRTFVLPRSQNVLLTGLIFRAIRQVFNFAGRLTTNPVRQESLLALYAPVTLVGLPFIWLFFLTLGFTAMYWALGIRPLEQAFVLSGSSLLTLGFSPVEGLAQTVLAFIDATLGLIIIALIIAYLPTMYAAFSRRETLVAKLEVYASTPPSPIEIIGRMYRINGIAHLRELFTLWETWFAEIEEAQTSFAPLNFFRSPKPQRSWVTAAGAVLDSAALTLAALDLPREPRAALCIRSGYLALRHIADFFNIGYDSDPQPGGKIHVTKEEFFHALDLLHAQGVGLKPNREQAWIDYSGWRINYDEVLVALAFITQAPAGVWSSDRLEKDPNYRLRRKTRSSRKENRHDR